MGTINKYITLRNGKSYLKKDYVIAKTKDLTDFGYGTLTEKEVENQIDKIFKGEKLNIIGLMIEDDIRIES